MNILPTISSCSDIPRFERHTGTVVPILSRKLDRSISHTGLDYPLQSERVFDVLDYLCSQQNCPEFVLKQKAYASATILLSDGVFGIRGTKGYRSGLSNGLPIRAIIARSFGPIFLSDAALKGVLLVPLDVASIERIAQVVKADPGVELTVDLVEQVLELPGQGPVAFETHPRLRKRLLHGLDDDDELRLYGKDAERFLQADMTRRPWLYNSTDDLA